MSDLIITQRLYIEKDGERKYLMDENGKSMCVVIIFRGRSFTWKFTTCSECFENEMPIPKSEYLMATPKIYEDLKKIQDYAFTLAKKGMLREAKNILLKMKLLESGVLEGTLNDTDDIDVGIDFEKIDTVCGCIDIF